MKVAARIWSGIAVILVAYVATVGLGAYFSRQTTSELTRARMEAFPATLAAADAIGDFGRQRAAYQAAVEIGEADQIAAAAAPAKEVLADLDGILAGSWLTAELRQPSPPCAMTSRSWAASLRASTPAWRRTRRATSCRRRPAI